MFSLVKVHAKGSAVEFYPSSIMNAGETVEGFLRRLNPMVVAFSHVALKTSFGNFIVFGESDFVGADEKVLEGSLTPFKTLDGFVFAFFGDIWLLPFEEKVGNIEIKNKKQFKADLAGGIEEALSYVEVNGSESVIFPQNIFNGLPVSSFDFNRDIVADVAQGFSNMSVYFLSHAETLVRLLCKTMLVSGLYFKFSGDKSLPLERLMNTKIAKKFFPKEDYIDLVVRLHEAVTSIFCFYARLVIEYAGVKVESIENFSMLTNPGIAADAIRKGIDAGRNPVVGRILLSGLPMISQLFGAYNFYMSYMLDVDGIGESLPLEDEKLFAFFGDFDSDEKNEELAGNIADLIGELAEEDARSAPAFKISATGLTDILWGTGM